MPPLHVGSFFPACGSARPLPSRDSWHCGRAMIAGYAGSSEMTQSVRRTGLVLLSIGVAAAAGVVGMRAAGSAEPALKTYHFTVKDLSEPSAPVANPPKVVPKPADAVLVLPPGFRAEIFAEDIKRPRMAIEA